MKRRSLLVAFALLGLLVTAPATQAAAPASPFAGTWYSHDPAPPDGDGSLLRFDISGGTKAQVVFTDYFGSICVNYGSPVTVFTALIVGTVDYDTNTFAGTWAYARCGPVRFPFIKGESMWLEYSANGDGPADDTLFDGFLTWTRVP